MTGFQLSFVRQVLALFMICAAMFCISLVPTESYGQGSQGQTNLEAEQQRPVKIEKRVPWTTSRVFGSPDPPAAYRVEHIFKKLSFHNPLEMTNAPGTDRLFIVQQGGKIFSFPNDQQCEKADLFYDVAGKIKNHAATYGLTFHPQFEKNRYCYICYVLQGTDPKGTIVSRFRVTETDPPRVDPASEQVVIRWVAGGHNGGCLKFGPDGCLYISTGDATSPNPPDALHTGQDLSDLLSSILRIDVDQQDQGRSYHIPKDNPFVELAGARPEIWSYGFRNPWKMSFDRKTGDLWVGDVGWELWEMIYRVERAGNYGWSIMEGRQPVRPEGNRGPTPILPPVVDHPHSESASITGGYVYHGKRLPGLSGDYVYGDYDTRKIWAFHFDGSKATNRRELVDQAPRVVAFAEDHQGELYILSYGGTIHWLVPNDQDDSQQEFPRRLSQTGLFASVSEQTPAAGVIPFSVNAPQWIDGAEAQRFVAVPDLGSIDLRKDKPIFPKDSVLVKTISLASLTGQKKSRRRLETQLLHFNGQAWRGYTYLWNEEQTDATLADSAGLDQVFQVADPQSPGKNRQQTWHFASRTECSLCHNPWAGHSLGFTLAQLNQDHASDSGLVNQLRTLEQIGLINKLPRTKEGQYKPLPKLSDPYDSTVEINDRARSYLHVNCAHCHRMGGGGTAMIDLRHEFPLSKTHVLAVRPSQGTFGIHAAHIVSPGDPFRSVLLYRTSKLGKGRMPYIGSNRVDERGLDLLQQWIAQLPTGTSEQESQEGVTKSRTAEQTALAHLSPQGKLDEQALTRLLQSTSGALMLRRAIDQKQLVASVQQAVIARAMAHPEAQVRDLFERFLPEEKRVKRLGSVVDWQAILRLPGDLNQGKRLFFETSGVQCKTCHQISGQGQTLGPELTHIGKKYNRQQLLESILQPSKLIEPKYLVYLVETTEGKVHTGVLIEKTAEQIVLKNAENKEIRLATEIVEQLVPQRRSIMPELLLREMTAQQVADLLAYLESLQ